MCRVPDKHPDGHVVLTSCKQSNHVCCLAPAARFNPTAHAIFDLKYHVIWCTKYRYKILRGRVAERARDLIRKMCEAREVVIVRGTVSPDHIHLLLSAPPILSLRNDPQRIAR